MRVICVWHRVVIISRKGKTARVIWLPVRLWVIRSRDSTRADGEPREHTVPDSYLAGGKTDAKAIEILHCWTKTKTIGLGRVLVIAQDPFLLTVSPSWTIPGFLSTTVQIMMAQVETLKTHDAWLFPFQLLFSGYLRTFASHPSSTPCRKPIIQAMDALMVCPLCTPLSVGHTLHSSPLLILPPLPFWAFLLFSMKDRSTQRVKCRGEGLKSK